MGRVLTNNISLAYAIEETLGVLPASPTWKTLEPNGINTFGASITTVARSPISKSRQRRKGTVTDLDSAVEFDGDMTLDHFIDFVEGFMFSSLVGQVVAVPTAVTGAATDEYTVPAMAAAIPAGHLVYARGFAVSANNGLKVVDAGGTTTTVPVTTDLDDEASPPDNCELAVCGVRSAAGDLEVDVTAGVVTITSTVLDFTTLGLYAGQMVWVGGDAALNRFTTANNKGFARVVSVAANALVIDKTGQTWATEAGAAQEVDIYFGRFVRNVSVDDSDYLEQSYQFEAAYPNLGAGGADEYEYAKGNYCNTLGFELPLTDKATLALAFAGTDTEPPDTTRATNADSPIEPLQTAAFNTSADIARLRIQQVDEVGLSTDFKSLTFNINNNVSPEKVLGQLGAKFMNTGNFEIDIEAQLLFTDGDVVAAVRDNTRVTMDFSIRNDDGAIVVDVPSMTLGDGSREYPVNESVLINTTAQAYGDATLGYSVGISFFPYAPNF
jgi:hypothetical protein